MGKSIYRDYQRTIAAGETIEINVFGRFLTLLENDGTNDALVSIAGQGEERFPAGVSVELPVENGREEFFGLLRIRNDNAGAIIIRLATSAGKIFDNRLLLSGSVFADILNQLQGDSDFVGYGQVAISSTVATQIVAAATTRKSVIIQNLPTNTGVMYIGYDNTVTATKNIVTLAPGQSYETDDFRGTLFALAAVNSEKVSYGEV